MFFKKENVPRNSNSLTKSSPWHDKIHFLKSVTSTNDLLLKWGEAGAVEGTSIIAETQTQGRGQFHRPWASPRGQGLWMSLLLRLPIENEIISSLSQLGPVALCDAFEKLELEIPALQIKAPNDVLSEGKKVAGVLVETRRGTVPFAVVGIGVNISQCLEDFPPELRDKATSLALASSAIIDHQELTTVLITSLYERYQQVLHAPQDLEASWQARLRLS